MSKKNIFKNVVLPVGASIAGFALFAGFAVFASTITTINGSDTISGSRTTINTNFSNLNTDKLESGNSAALLTISSSTVGTLRIGTFTATSTATSTAAGGISTAGLSSTAGLTITGGSILNTSAATSSFTGGLSSIRYSSTATSTFAGLTLSSGSMNVATLLNCNGANVLETDASGNLQCGTDAGAAGTVTSVADSGTGTLTISPTTGDVVAAINLANANSWTGGQTFVNATSSRMFYGVQAYFSSTSIGSLVVGSITSTSTATTTFAGGVSATAFGATATSTLKGVQTSGGLTIVGLGTGLTLSTAGKIGLYTGATCTNQFVRSLDASGAATCATVGSADVSLANLTATDSTLTFSGTYTGATARTIGLNLGNANIWTALQKFAYTGTTTVSAGLEAGTGIGTPWINATSTTATSTFNGGINLVGGGLKNQSQVVYPFGFGGLPYATSTLSYVGSYVQGTTYVVIGNGTASSTATQCSAAGTEVSPSVAFTARQDFFVSIGTAAGTTTIRQANFPVAARLIGVYCKADSTATPNIITVSPTIRTE